MRHYSTLHKPKILQIYFSLAMSLFFFFLSVLKLLCSLLVLQAYGEEIVREVFPEATIIRPSDTFGHEDRLLNYYASLRVFPFGFVPMLDGGMKTYKRPVYVSGMSGMF